MSRVRPEWHGCTTLGADRGSFTPARRCVSYVLRCLIPTSFAGAQRITLLSGFVRHWFMQHTLGANRGSSVLWFFTARHDHCVWLTPSDPRPHTLVSKTPSQIGQTSLFLASWSPFTNMGCAAPAMDVFVSSLIARGMGVLVDVDAYHVHRSSSVRLLSSSWVGSSVSVSLRECPSSCVTRTLGCSSESVPASTGQQLNAPHLPE